MIYGLYLLSGIGPGLVLDSAVHTHCVSAQDFFLVLGGVMYLPDDQSVHVGGAHASSTPVIRVNI